ncbi:MAG: helix-turn-helix domain-containing protein [Ruminococcus sp.]|nr:helix-turn-helix domain-containing protein [Ruminococcus sp.]
MNQENIGKFIAECRRNKKITQSELAEQLGVTDRSVSNWENGKNMPDLSLFKPLCQILDITINELLSGEKLSKQEYQEKFEENIVNTIDYSTHKLNKYKEFISLILIIFGLFISLSAIMIFPSESSWGSVYSVFGIIIFMIGISKLLRQIKWYKRLSLLILIFVGAMAILLFTDYINVKYNSEAPMFRITTTTTGNVIYYDTPFYDVYRCNFDKKDEYWVISKNSNPTINELIDYCK